jgi:hypothetical protein
MEAYESILRLKDDPVLLLKPSTEAGRFKGRLNDTEVDGEILALRGLSEETVLRAVNGDGDVLKDYLVEVAGSVGEYTLVGCRASLLDDTRHWASSLNGASITEL